MLKPADYTRWKRKTTWRLNEAVALMLGIEPGQEIQEDDQVYDDYGDMLDTVKRSERKDLPTTGRTQINLYVEIYASVNQADFLKWAKRKEYDIPDELSDILDSQEKFDSRERTTLLQIIAVLAAEAELDLTKHSKAAGFLLQMGAKHGLELRSKQDTIANKLKEARELQ